MNLTLVNTYVHGHEYISQYMDAVNHREVILLLFLLTVLSFSKNGSELSFNLRWLYDLEKTTIKQCDGCSKLVSYSYKCVEVPYKII